MSCRDFPAPEDFNSLQPRLCRRLRLPPDLLPTASPPGEKPRPCSGLSWIRPPSPPSCSTARGGEGKAPCQPALCLPRAKQFSAPSKYLPAHPSGAGGSSLVRRQWLPACTGTWPRLVCTGGVKEREGKAVPSTFFCFDTLANPLSAAAGFPAPRIGSPACTLPPVAHGAPDSPNTWQGAAQDDCAGQAEVFGLKSQARVSRRP